MNRTVYVRINDIKEQRDLSMMFPLIDPCWEDVCKLRTTSQYTIGNQKYVVYWIGKSGDEDDNEVQIIERILKEETYE